MSERAQRLRRVGESRAMVRANLNARDSMTNATRYPRVARINRTAV